MLDFKFRAWDKVDKKMEPITDIDFLLSKAFVGFKLGERQYKHFPERIEIMQATRCKDKNGNDIYEGDIIDLPITDVCSGGGCCKVYVKGNNGCSGHMRRVVEWVHSGYSINPHGCDIDVKIVGNIYENPELLNN